MTMGYGYGGRRTGGFKARLAVAAVIALIAIITYFSRTQVNPVTGEKQRVALTADQEKVLGLQAAPEMAAQMGGVIDPASDPRAAMVAQVGKRLVSSSDAQKSPYVGNFNFYLLNDDSMVNAFALPGGQIFITEALYDRLENEAQLAGVLGHEIGHVIHRHGAEHMAKGQLGQLLVTAVGVGASDDPRQGQMAAMAAAMASQMIQLRYGRQDELESDSTGMSYMVQSGYDPSQMRRVMQILKEASGSRGGASIFASHPDPDARIAEIEAFLKRHYPGGVPAGLEKGRALQ